MQLTPFPGLPRSSQKPSTTAVSYVRVFLLDLVTSTSATFACLSYLPCFASFGPFPHGVIHQQVPDLRRLQGVKPDHSCARVSNHRAHQLGENEPSPFADSRGKITTGIVDSSCHHFDLAVRTERRSQHDVVMHELCACLTQIREAASLV